MSSQPTETLPVRDAGPHTQLNMTLLINSDKNFCAKRWYEHFTYLASFIFIFIPIIMKVPSRRVILQRKRFKMSHC